jgi:hypothetical protein
LAVDCEFDVFQDHRLDPRYVFARDRRLEIRDGIEGSDLAQPRQLHFAVPDAQEGPPLVHVVQLVHDFGRILVLDVGPHVLVVEDELDRAPGKDVGAFNFNAVDVEVVDGVHVARVDLNSLRSLVFLIL